VRRGGSSRPSVRSGPGHDFFDDCLHFGAIDLAVDLLRETIHGRPNLFQPATVFKARVFQENGLVFDPIEASVDLLTKALQCFAEDREWRPNVLQDDRKLSRGRGSSVLPHFAKSSASSSSTASNGSARTTASSRQVATIRHPSPSSRQTSRVRASGSTSHAWRTFSMA